MLPFWARVDLGAKQVKGYTVSPKLQHFESLIIILFSVISKKPVARCLTPLQRCSRCILQPKSTGLRTAQDQRAMKLHLEKDSMQQMKYRFKQIVWHLLSLIFLRITRQRSHRYETQFLPGSGHIDTAIWMHYMDANKTAGEETRWQLHKNAACNPEQVLAATPHKTPTVRPPAPYHENYSS